MRHWAILWVLSLASCAHFHGDHDAPGVVDPRAPSPARPNLVEAPRDPGEQMIVLSPGPFLGGGATIGGPDGTRGSGSFGAEASVFLGRSDRSHAEDDYFLYPQRSFGANLGWTLLSSERAGPTTGYMEFQYADEAVGAAAGWAWDPHARSTGPQATVFAGPLYGRVTVLLDDRTTVEAGLLFKLPVVWVESR
jgi:hypothetical protein